jgi:hypothetical protein
MRISATRARILYPALHPMPSPVDFDALSYAQRLQALLRAQRLPDVINLGSYNQSCDGQWVQQDGFVRMTEEQLQQLARQLEAQPNVKYLNLNGNGIGPDGMRVLAAPLAMLTNLDSLFLQCTLLQFGAFGA